MVKKASQGFIKILLIVIAILFVLTYFGVNFRQVVDSDTGQENISFLKEIGTDAWSFCQSVWSDYLAEPVGDAYDFIKDKISQE